MDVIQCLSFLQQFKINYLNPLFSIILHILAHRMFYESFPTFKDNYKFAIFTNISLIHPKLEYVGLAASYSDLQSITRVPLTDKK